MRCAALILMAFLLLPARPAGAEEPRPFTLAFVGDFLPGASAEGTVRECGYDTLFDGVRPLLEQVDGLVVNLETPLARHGTPMEGKTFTFLCSPEAAAAMTRAKVKAATLANNHILDQGVRALRETIAVLDGAGIPHAGAGENLTEAASPAVLALGGQQLSILAFSLTYPEEFWAGGGRPGTAFGHRERVVREVEKAAARGPVIVCFHWGAEMMETPKPYQVELAHAAIEAGADAVIGHHPHVNQPLEVYRGRPIAYSLGNFSFGSTSRRSRYGLWAALTFGADGSWTGLSAVPLLVANAEVAYRPRPVGGEEGERVFSALVAGLDPATATAAWDGSAGTVAPVVESAPVPANADPAPGGTP